MVVVDDTPIVIDKLVRVTFAFQKEDTVARKNLSFVNLGVKKLRNTPIYVKPQLNSESGTCRVSVMVRIRNDPGKAIDSVLVQFQLPSCLTWLRSILGMEMLLRKSMSMIFGVVLLELLTGRKPISSAYLKGDESLVILVVEPTNFVGEDEAQKAMFLMSNMEEDTTFAVKIILP
ncbi:hypothetical protein Tco_0656464 [Tanacetum coccineum]|uniref:Uncharacterized protein n=1 Tax=Tanacetum coccineum TaxID=301880 RepID=A0ABQ4X8U2_9ASTR